MLSGTQAHPTAPSRLGSNWELSCSSFADRGEAESVDTYHLMEAMLGPCSWILGNAACAILPTKRQDGGQGGVPDFHLKSNSYYQLSWLWNPIFSFEMKEDEPLFLNLAQEELKRGGLETCDCGPRAMTHRAARSEPRK